jgi:Ca2+:H+ antiporter
MAIGAFMVAVISASPELITAVKSASDDRMQTVVNIALGATLSTVLLTVPAVLIVSYILGFDITLAITPLQGSMIGLTLIACVIHFNDGETNALEGFVHLILFVMFCFLLFV